MVEHKRLEEHGYKLTIFAPTPSVQRIRDSRNFDQVFRIEP